VAAGLIIAVLAGTAFAATQRRAGSPMLPPALLRRPGLAAGSLVGLLINLGFYGQLFVFSLYLQQVRGESALTAGLSLLPEAAVVPVASAVSGRLTGRGGPRVTMLAGLGTGAAGLLALAVTGPGTPYWMLVPPMLAAGGRLEFVPGLRLALAGCGGAFLLGAIITLAAMGRTQPGTPSPSARRAAQHAPGRREPGTDGVDGDALAAQAVIGGCGPGGLPTPSTVAGTRAGSRTARSAGWPDHGAAA